MSRQARTRSSLVLGLIAFLVAGAWFASRQLARAGDSKDTVIADAATPAAKKDSAARAVVYPVPTDFKAKLLAAGLSPRALAAAGVSSISVLPTLQAAADQMNAAPIALDNAEETRSNARVAADALARKIQSGKASQEEIASYPAAKAALESAEAACQSVLDGYFTAATANLTSNQRAALITIRANKAWTLPEQYLVVNRSESSWVALRDALANERIAVELPGSASQSCTDLLSTVRADPAVSFATTSIQTGLTQITTAWNTAAGD
jgi:hypothetical protein